MKIIECDQGTDAWLAARAGIPTASEFSTVLAKGKDGGASVTRRKYLYKLAGERLTGDPAENYSNQYMDRGHVLEPQAREDYAFINDVEPEIIGFVTTDDGGAGCSPDSFIGAAGALEIKTGAPHILLDHMFKGEFPTEHKAQCQGVLWVAEREWIDLLIYWPKMKPFIVRAARDEAYIRDLASAVAKFNEEIVDVVDRYRRLGAPGRLQADLKASLVAA